MSRAVQSALVALVLGAGVSGGQAFAGNEGQEDLDKATQAKLNVKTLTDLAKVIDLCESALKKGLDEDNTQFAKKLLASTLVQRGTTISRTIFDTLPPDPRWAEYRRVALEDLEKAVKLDPQQPEALFRIAQLNLLPEGDRKRAVAALDESIGQAKDDPTIKAQALALRPSLQPDAAKKLADLDEAIRTAPGDVAAIRTRASDPRPGRPPE